MVISLILGALTMAALAGLHSYIGETRLLQRLLAMPALPSLNGSIDYTRAILRWAWHLTSVAWLGFAGVFVALTQIPVDARLPIGFILVACLGLSAIIVFVVTRGRHLAWIFFLVSAVCAFIGIM